MKPTKLEESEFDAWLTQTMKVESNEQLENSLPPIQFKKKVAEKIKVIQLLRRMYKAIMFTIGLSICLLLLIGQIANSNNTNLLIDLTSTISKEQVMIGILLIIFIPLFIVWEDNSV